MGRATNAPKSEREARRHFNPRPPWGGRRLVFVRMPCGSVISIHALRGEGDPSSFIVHIILNISIHALRGEGDLRCARQRFAEEYFNPRPPWGGRRQSDVIDEINASFQSTPSVGRATQRANSTSTRFKDFNPRPPWGGRPKVKQGKNQRKHFNPRPPWGGRPGRANANAGYRHFNPRPPWGGRHYAENHYYGFNDISIHALRGEGDGSIKADRQ